ncbi:MAG: futalosine hydrolase [Desulfomicrobium sp.]|nr:futalosine hydrolase [Desulfomicrobium sp.]NLV96431.1 futalosine hydrolase [Desulfovibrionales bacterium]
MIILACATQRECLSALDGISAPPKAWPAPMRFKSQDLLACVVGIGPIAAALHIGILLEQYPHTTGIINLGICGTYDSKNIPMLSTCIADAEIFPEYGIRCSSDEQEMPFAHQMLPDLSLTPPHRLNLTPYSAAKNMGLNLPQSWPVGHSITVSGVSGDRKRADILNFQYMAATENMEGFALALAAHKYNIPFLEVRTVSNIVGIQDKSQWKIRQALTALSKILPTLIAS